MNGALISESVLYSQEELLLLDPARIPSHIAIIMDGNRRWAKRQGFPPMLGHWCGAETLSNVVRAASELGVKALTVYVFSTENWNRSFIETQALMHLLKSYLHRKLPSMLKEGIRLSAIGDLTRLSSDIRQVLEKTIEQTSRGQTIELILAISYGGRDEMRRAICAMIKDCLNGKLSQDSLSEESIIRYLDTAGRPDPELLIRTGGESRLSNFLLWQTSYTEMFISKILWPDFTARDLLDAIIEYQKRESRRGI